MSKYTTEVRYICETLAGLDESVGYSKVDEVIDKSMDKVFDFEYPIFDEKYRPVLQKKILKHFYAKEIGAESVGLWKLWLSNRLNEVMPYYNQMYKSELLEFNPLYDVDYTREHDGESSGNHKNLYSDTPQGSVQNVENETYLTNATVDKVDNTQNYLEHVKGKFGGTSYAKMLNDYRSTFLNIDMMVINELNDLFMNLW